MKMKRILFLCNNIGTIALILSPAVVDVIISLSGIIFIYYLFKNYRSFDKFLNLL